MRLSARHALAGRPTAGAADRGKLRQLADPTAIRPLPVAAWWPVAQAAGVGAGGAVPPASSRRTTMARKTTWTLVLALTLAAAAAYVATIRATPASGFTGTTVASGRFDTFEVFNHAATAPPSAAHNREAGGKPSINDWLSLQRTRGASDLYIQNNVWTPGGSTGWHSHPGHSLIVVTEGTVTVYDGDDPSCAPRHYTVGMGFVDEGGDHVHVIRNEGAIDARTMAVQLIPAGAPRRIDASANPACPF
jgi:hypothetical protein